MEKKNNTIKDKIAMFNQITTFIPKTENNHLKKPLIIFDKSIINEPKFPAFKLIKKDIKNDNTKENKEQIIKNEEKKENNTETNPEIIKEHKIDSNVFQEKRENLKKFLNQQDKSIMKDSIIKNNANINENNNFPFGDDISIINPIEINQNNSITEQFILSSISDNKKNNNSNNNNNNNNLLSLGINLLNTEKLKEAENSINSCILLDEDDLFLKGNNDIEIINNNMKKRIYEEKNENKDIKEKKNDNKEIKDKKDEHKIIIKHRYKENNFDFGREFFKNRFINRKIEKYKEKNENNQSIKLIDIDKLKIKFQILYYKKVEKSILCFNLKLYMDSYNILLSNKIIDKLEEFGEFLLVINGFDKFIIGEFLSKNHPPNENKIILQSFIQSINFQNIPFINGLKFFLTRINLPKDANLILDIINYFSVVFYNDNKLTNLYKDINSIYLLSSTTLAINTMFVRTDIKNINIITKEQFIEMNNEIDKETVSSLYDNIKKNNIIWSQEYKEAIYRRLCIIVKEKEENYDSNLNDNEIDDEEFNEKINNYEKRLNQERKTLVIANNLRNLTSNDVNLLRDGDLFYKYIKNSNNGHYKYLKFSNNLLSVMWSDNKIMKTFDKSHIIDIYDIKDVIMGIHNSNFKINENDDKNLYFSICTNNKDYNFKGKNIEIVTKWYKAIKSLLNVINKKKENQKMIKVYEEKEKMKLLIYDIWLNIIQNWDFYGNFFLSQIESKRAYNYNLNSKYFNLDEGIDENKLNIKDISIKLQNNKKISKKELFYIYENGIPKNIRKTIWSFFIGNKISFSEELFIIYLNKFEPIDFIQIIEQYNSNHQIKFSNDQVVNKIIFDIIKLEEKYYEQFEICNQLSFNIMSDLYKIIRVFYLYRPDIIYNENILLIAMMFLLNGENCYNSFVNLINFIFTNYIGKFILKDKFFISNFETFFIQNLKKYCPKVEKHFNNFEITPSLYLCEWCESLFCKVLNYDIIIRIWDLFLLKGEYIIFQTAIAIIILQEENLLNLTINEIFELFETTIKSNKINNIFSEIKKINIKEDYYAWKISYQLVKKKSNFNLSKN